MATTAEAVARDEAARWDAFSSDLVEVRRSRALARAAPDLPPSQCRGVFVRRGVTLAVGQLIGRYCGETVTAADLVDRYGAEGLARYALEVDGVIVDAEAFGTSMRFINDYRFGVGEAPNVVFDGFDVRATVPIPAGTELLVSYGDNYF